MIRPARHVRWVALLSAATLGCRQDMHDQPKLEAFEGSAFFEDGLAMRPHVPGTIARGHLESDAHLYTGRVRGEAARTFPFPMTRAVLERGRERFDVFCAVCHGPCGDGDGMVVQRGFKRPPSFHEQRLIDAAPGRIFDVISSGYGAMFDFADRIPARDRWAIVGWLRVLQRSRNAGLDDVPEEQRTVLEAAR